jgi:hypothetical protein
VYAFTIPGSLGGVYAITAQVLSSVTVTSGGLAIGCRIGARTYIGTALPTTVSASVAVPAVAFADGGQFSISVANLHSATISCDVVIEAYRLFI